MYLKTKITNLTYGQRKFPWLGERGLFLESGETVEIEGDVWTRCDERMRKVMDADLEEGNVFVAYDTDRPVATTASSVTVPPVKKAPVVEPKTEQPKKAEKKTVKPVELTEQQKADERIRAANLEDRGFSAKTLEDIFPKPEKLIEGGFDKTEEEKIGVDLMEVWEDDEGMKKEEIVVMDEDVLEPTEAPSSKALSRTRSGAPVRRDTNKISRTGKKK